MSGESTTLGVGGPRRLAAILAADIAGYSRLMGVDEEGTLARMKRHRREIIEPTLQEHYGRVIKMTGDGFLAVFDSPLEAVRAAIVIQQSLAARNTALPKAQWIQYRIGVNLGDVIVDDDDIYGEGVNIAARIETLAEPGGVYISGGVYEQIKHKLVCGYQSLGDEKLKNITDPVRIYRVLPDPAAVTRAKGSRFRWPMAASVAALACVGIGWYALGFIPPRALPDAVRAQVTDTAAERQVADAGTAAAIAPVPAPAAASAPVPASVAAQAQAPAAASAPAPAPVPAQAPAAATGSLPGLPPPPSPPTDALPIALPQGLAAPPAAPPAPAPVPGTQVAVVAPPPPAAAMKPVDSRAGFRDCQRCPEMVRIPAGTFRMGSAEDPSEMPMRQVHVEAFALGRYPVTVGEWKQCAAAKACSLALEGDETAPALNLSWNDAQQYVEWLSKSTGQRYRLPSEAEWEYAARGGTAGRYWWGEKVTPSMANCRGCGETYNAKQVMPVGRFPPNPFGLHDMTGSVAQWVADCWLPTYQGAPADASVRTVPNCRENVLRGGSWRNDASYARSASRMHYDTTVRYPVHGIRVARELP